MESDARMPTFDPRSIREIIFFYWDRHDDIASIHINERRAAFMIEGDHGIHLREADGEIVGMDVYDFGRAYPRCAALSRVAIPAIAEIEAFAGRELDERFEVRATPQQLPLTTHMLIFAIAYALGAHEAELHAELAGMASSPSGLDV